jgi:hypothetical protein
MLEVRIIIHLISIIENVNVYAGVLMMIGVIGTISFGLSFAITYLKHKGYNPEKLLKF